jgi:hypothetical protein
MNLISSLLWPEASFQVAIWRRNTEFCEWELFLNLAPKDFWLLPPPSHLSHVRLFSFRDSLLKIFAEFVLAIWRIERQDWRLLRLVITFLIHVIASWLRFLRITVVRSCKECLKLHVRHPRVDCEATRWFFRSLHTEYLLQFDLIGFSVFIACS